MNNQVLRRVLELIEVRKYESGQVIATKGAESEHVHLVLHGEVFLFDPKSSCEEIPSKEDLALASRSTTTTMKKLSVGGLVGQEAFAGE